MRKRLDLSYVNGKRKSIKSLGKTTGRLLLLVCQIKDLTYRSSTNIRERYTHQNMKKDQINMDPEKHPFLVTALISFPKLLMWCDTFVMSLPHT